MSRGLTNREIYTRVYTRLHRVQYLLKQNDVDTVYKNKNLIFADGKVAAFYHIGHMSNGETVGTLFLDPRCKIILLENGHNEYEHVQVII